MKINAWEALANKYADANVTKKPQTAGNLPEKLEKNHKNLDASDRNERFRPGGGPPTAAVPHLQPAVPNLQPFPYLQPLQIIQSLKPLVTFSRDDDDADPHDKINPFLVSYLRN